MFLTVFRVVVSGLRFAFKLEFAAGWLVVGASMKHYFVTLLSPCNAHALNLCFFTSAL